MILGLRLIQIVLIVVRFISISDLFLHAELRGDSDFRVQLGSKELDYDQFTRAQEIKVNNV